MCQLRADLPICFYLKWSHFVFLFPCFTFVLAKHAATLGLLAVVLSVCAMLWNFLYNWLFDVLERLLGGRRFSRKIWLRFVHAGVFELSLCLASVPFVISLLHDSFLARIKH